MYYGTWREEELKKHILIGKVIADVNVGMGGEDITFDIQDGKSIVATCDAECCSHTWIENVELPALGFPATVLEVQDLDMPDLGDLPGCDCVAYYGFKIITDKGEIIIDYRNDSNGYYGGSLDWPRSVSA